MSDASPLRGIPPVNAALAHPEVGAIVATYGRAEAVRSVREALDEAREAVRDCGKPPDLDAIARRAAEIARNDRGTLRPVINATGVLLNTGLGRAPIAPAALDLVRGTAAGYCNLEFDLETGTRGDRTSRVEALLRRLTGAESAAVVNNNAAATILALKAIASGREVIVSRGQLVEIGGSFRLPEIFEASGARLREVGTTNKTRLADYARAIGPETAALMRVHTGNYRIVGFTESVEIADLASLARDRGLVAIDDVGSGLLRRDDLPGLVDEPTVADSIREGADLVLFSGDKLLGGPQSGILAGRSDLIARVKADPLMRALRVDKMTIAALQATLERSTLPSGIPLRDLLTTPIESLRGRARQISRRLAEVGFPAESVDSEAMLGGGSDPARAIPSAAVRLTPPFPGRFGWDDVAGLVLRLRQGNPAVVARVHRGAVWLDLIAVFSNQDDAIVSALIGAAPSD